MIKLSWLFSAGDNDDAERAINYIKRHKKELIEKFASDDICPSSNEPVSFFMAGTPGAGKTQK